MFYIVSERIRDGEFEYYSPCILKLQEGEEPSEHIFLKKMYEDVELEFDEYANAWHMKGDYRYIDIYHWYKIESEEHKQILNKYGIH